MTISELKKQLRQRDAQINAQAARIKELEREIGELKKLLVEKAQSKEAKPPKDATNYSVDRHERKRRKKRRKKSTGRRRKEAKAEQATLHYDLYWYGDGRDTCVLRREQLRGAWAHFLRKAIALSLRNPGNRQYARFLKSLFAVYYSAVRASHDGRLSVGRPAIAKKLQSRIHMICHRYGEGLKDAASADDGKFVLLQNELVDNTEKLFVFVLHPEVEPTNNRSERQARPEAMARKAARTSKTEHGAQRRSVIMSVLASLSKRTERFTLGNVLAEVKRWLETGLSVFQEDLANLHPAAGPP
jgi:hypothetical protein